MKNKDDIRNLIDIPKELDDAVALGIMRGKKERKKKFRVSKPAVAAAVALAIGATVTIARPDIVKAIPGIGSIFNLMKENRDGVPFNKFESFKTSVNKTVEDNGIKITMDEIAIDDNMMGLSFIVEGKDLKETKDVFDFRGNIELNDKQPGAIDWKAKRIDNNKIAVFLISNISDLNLPNEVKFSWHMSGVNEVVGDWNFNFKVNKGAAFSQSKVIKVNKTKDFGDFKFNIDKIVISPISSTINYSGEYTGPTKDMRQGMGTGISEFIVLDKNDNPLYARNGGGNSNNKRFDGKIEIYSDISDLDSIKVVPMFDKCEGYTGIEALQCNFSKDDPTEVITKSRPVNEQEKKDGYAYDKVTYHLTIDKAHKFYTLDEIKNNPIWLNEKEYLTLEKVEDTSQDKTKLTFKINGAYTHRVLNSFVVFDEEFNDTKLGEGGSSKVEDIKNKIESIELPKLDKNKKYKFAVQKKPLIEIERGNVIDVNLSDK